MQYRFSSVDKTKEKKSREIMNSLYLGGSLISGSNDFDINSYLNQSKKITNNTTNARKIYPKKLSLKYRKFIKPLMYDIYNKDNELNNKTNRAFSLEKEKKEKNIYNYLNTETYNDNKTKNYLNISIHPKYKDKKFINNTQFPSKLKLKPIIFKDNISPLKLKNNHNKRLYSRDSSITEENNFNSIKIIKDIKKGITRYNNENKKADYYKIIPSYQNKIAYDENFENVVLDANKMINNHIYKDKELNVDDIDVNNFILKNKKISVNNVLIELMKNKNKKLKNENEIRDKTIQSFGKIIQQEEQNFENLTFKHNTLCTKTNSLFKEINNNNSMLVNLLYNYTKRNETLEDNIFKIIEQIESIRIYAKFVHKLLGGDDKIFENEIIPDYKNNEKPEINYLINEVYDKYGHLLKNSELNTKYNNTYSSENKDNNKNLKLKLGDDNDNDNKDGEEGIDNSLLEDPYLIIRKFKELEDKIIHLVQRREIFNKNKYRESEENNKIIKELKDRILKLEKEYNYENNILKEYKNNELGNNSKDNIKEELYMIAHDLCQMIHQSLNNGEKKIKKTKNNKNHLNSLELLEINEDIVTCFNIMAKKENQVNKLIEKLESLEKNDATLFNEVILKKKIEFKKINQMRIKEDLEKNELNKKYKANEKYNKLIIKLRKSEPRRYLEKKEVKIKVDEKDSNKNENEDFLVYE